MFALIISSRVVVAIESIKEYQENLFYFMNCSGSVFT
jgi:hypothetical protein